MLKVLSDAYSAADAGDVTPLSLLDLRTAFDSVDHQILIERLQRTFGVRGRALDWLSSYLSGRTQFVRYSGATSSVASVSRCVPQGSVSVLGPVLFIMYVADVIKLVEDHELTPHAYADDLQIYGHSTPAQSSELTSCIEECINQVQAWMASNRLRLNHTKTEFIMVALCNRADHYIFIL